MSLLCFIAFISKAQTIQSVTSMGFYDRLDSLKNSESAIIIDCRNIVKYNEGHLPEAINIDAFSDDVQVQVLKYITTQTIVVYCMENTRSEAMIKVLKENNYKGIIIDITDGYRGWTENNLPVEK